uniref:Uncharacterized protein n=1 Tax=Arundo donax TaxID=35708 RepID=A0A0A9DSV4_ARUDO
MQPEGGGSGWAQNPLPEDRTRKTRARTRKTRNSKNPKLYRVPNLKTRNYFG